MNIDCTLRACSGFAQTFRDTCMNIVYEGDGDATGLTETPV